MTDDRDRTDAHADTTSDDVRDAIDEARRILNSAQRITSFSGAGLSAESGVPTFRDKASGGLWAKYDPMQLASADGFADNPELVLEWYAMRRRALAAAAPNPAHRALAARADITHVTQNVDDLLERAGAKNVLHVHGRIDRDRCHRNCGYDTRIDLNNPPVGQTCPQCSAPLRPGVVWFGEMLPLDVWEAAEHACAMCDVLLVIGTSGVVYPAAGLIDLARSRSARIIVVNTQAADGGTDADLHLVGPAGRLVHDIVLGPSAD